MLDEIIALLAIRSLVTAVVQLDPQQGLDCGGITQEKVHMLSVNPIGGSAEEAGIAGFGIEQLSQTDLWEDGAQSVTAARSTR